MTRWDSKDSLGAVRLLALGSELGLAVAVPIALGAMGGAYLDKRFGRSGIFTLIFLFIGLAAGVYGAYRIVAREMRWKP